ncbi:MAG: hypothetical protein CO094_06930 [Anaerolineae bacterium CG_4_9_14_3_um_filter_57_17]|nr:hypothetical protein [bacterium]NCT21707.1 hypothetical protein [bacterium]OIO84539.1 MAG: hypothetical protein AUK01_08980 [Anaerolineae bacterium CG2_30_57_67]PJB66499.1 MAG: hypothetical protein CO094_06930 [Anaerolineae bacterium CG_4_9_14_3_um_filter_57_17]
MPKTMRFLLICAFILTACAPQTSAPAAQETPIAPAATLIGMTVSTTIPAVGATLAPADSVTPAPVTITPLAENSYIPLLSDKDLMVGQVYLQQMEVLTLETYPPQFILSLTGSLPTPCHALRVRIETPDAQNRIQITVYSVTNPKMMCVQMLKEFRANVALGSFPSGTYSVWVNGQSVGQIEP